MDSFIRQAAEKLASIDKAGSFHKDSVVAILSLIREHLEANNLRSIHKITNLYCNWLLHPKLDRPDAVEVLNDLTRIITDQNEVNLNDRINEAISISGLRAELVEIMESIGAKTRLFSSHSGWKSFLSAVLLFLVEKPIERKSDPDDATKFAAKLELNVPDVGSLDRDYITEFSLSKGAVFWQILVKPTGCTLSGPLVLTEHPENFDLP